VNKIFFVNDIYPDFEKDCWPIETDDPAIAARKYVTQFFSDMDYPAKTEVYVIDFEDRIAYKYLINIKMVPDFETTLLESVEFIFEED
jgi:hypothetical protein